MKKKGKKDKPQKKNFLSELETLTYEQQLSDNNRQLARLRIHNEELEVKVESLRKKLNELEENKVDLTSHLEEVLQKKTVEAQELHERLVAFEKIYNQEQQDFKKKEELLEHDFQTMEHNLTAEIKLAAGKLNALEEWRLNRIDLMTKFEEQEKHMVEQEIRHKKILYEAEKKFIIGKAKMQKELENRLMELAENFKVATNLRLADTTQRAVRENFSLHKEMNRLLGHCRELDTNVQNYKEYERIWQLHSSLYESEAHLALKKVVKQSSAIKHLAAEHDLMSKAIGLACRDDIYRLRCQNAVKKAKKNYIKLGNKTRLLEQHIELTHINREDMTKKVIENCQNIQRLEEILGRAKEMIKQALLMQAELADKEDVCPMCYVDVKENLFRSLLEILESYQEMIVEDEEETKSESIENLYAFGNLGLIPTFLDINVPNISRVEPLNSNKNDIKSLFDQREGKIIPDESSTISQCLCD